MSRWLVKGDPDDYGAPDLERDGATVWTGVRNPQAQANLRAMRTGDEVLVYHTGGEKTIVALARVSGGPKPDPTDKTGKAVAVELEFKDWLKRPVSLAEIRARPVFKDFLLVRISRLSVMPVSAAEWKAIIDLAASEA